LTATLIVPNLSSHLDRPARVALHLLSRSLFGISAFAISAVGAGAATCVAAVTQIAVELL
jgi:hypothetical protein